MRRLVGWESVVGFSGRKGEASCQLARTSVAFALAAMLASAGCGTFQGPKGRSTAAPKRHAALACAAPADVLAGVYHPYRLHVLSPCRAVSGTVLALSHERDGDVHVEVDTDGALTNTVNASDMGGSLVVELMPRDGGHLPVPMVGEHIGLTGAWVLDTNHGWNELHPVWSETLAGITYHSGPQYGGSPPEVGSARAAADCTSDGVPCRGYGGGT